MMPAKRIIRGVVGSVLMIFGLVIHIETWLTAWFIHLDSWDLWVYAPVALVGTVLVITWCRISFQNRIVRVHLPVLLTLACIISIVLPILQRTVQPEGSILYHGYMIRESDFNKPKMWLDMLQADSKELRGEALNHLIPMGKRAVPGLLELLAHRNELTRHAASIGLREIVPQSSRAIEAFLQALKDRNSSVRMNMVIAIGRIGKDARYAAPELERLVDSDPAGKVRIAVHYALAAIGRDPDCHLQAIVEQVKNGIPLERAVACGYLADLFPKFKDTVFIPLLDALNDNDPSVREAALGALRKITGQDFGDESKKWNKWWEQNKERAYNGK